MPQRYPIAKMLATLAYVALSGCGGRHFDIVRTATVALDAGEATSLLAFDGFAPLTLLDDTLLRQQDVSRGDLTEVRVRSITLTVLTPGSSQDLSFLSGVTVAIGTDRLPSRVLATGASFAANENLGVLAVAPDDFVAYFAAADPQITVTTQGQPAPQAIVLRANLTLSLGVSSNRILVD